MSSPPSNQEPTPGATTKRERPSDHDPHHETSAQVSKRFKNPVSHFKDAIKNASSLIKVLKMIKNQKEEELLLPTQLLNSQECVAQTLTVSDQHATLLLTTKAAKNSSSSGEGGNNTSSDDSAYVETKSILKLTLVPFFKDVLGGNPVIDPNDTLQPELKLLENDPRASKHILSFLQSYNFHLKSESGAEYSYYDAIPSNYNFSKCTGKKTGTNGESNEKNGSEESTNKAKIPGSFNLELISPASERQIKRAMPAHSTVLIEETPEMYKEVVQPFIQSIVESGSLNWIFNIIQGEKEKERLLFNNDLFIINIDTKWRSHPDAFKTPREEWYHHESIGDLYCLGITKVKSIASLRDLTKDHIPMLEDMKREGLNVIKKVYGVAEDQIRVFVHYHPQFYHFHVHFTRLHNEIGSTVERGHLLSDIIQNLIMDSEFYSKRTITYKMKVSSPLYLLIQQQKQKSENE